MKRIAASLLALVAGSAGLLRGDLMLMVKPGPKSPGQAVPGLAVGDLRQAEQAFRQTLRRDPKDLTALLGLAEILLKRKATTAEAVTLTQRALTIAPNEPAVLWGWARCLVAQNKLGEAERVYLRASRFRGHPGLAMEIGDFYLLAMRNPQKAVEAFHAAVALAPSDFRARQALGTALAAAGDKQQAEAAFREAERLMPASAALHAQGLRYAEQRQFDKAIETLSKCIAADGRFADAYVSRGDVFAARNQNEKALADYEAASRLTPNSAHVRVRIGVAQQRSGRADKAEQAFLAAIQLDPRNAPAYNNLAWAAAERKVRLDEALGWARKAISLRPGIPNFQDTLAWVHRARGELNLAVSTLEQACKLTPQQPEVFFHLGVVYSEKGRPRDAAASLQRAFNLNRDFEGAGEARKLLASLNSR